MLRRYVTWVVDRPRTIIFAVLLVTLGLAYFIRHGSLPPVDRQLSLALDVDDQIPPGHKLVVVGKRVEKLFGGKYMTVVGVYVEQGSVLEPKVIGKIKRITEELEKIDGVKPGSVISLTSPRIKDVKSTEEALEVTSLVDEPLLEKLGTDPAADTELKERVERNKLTTSLITSDDRKSTSILVDFSDFEKAGGAPGVYPKLESILEKEREPGVEIVAAGAPTILYWLMQYTRRVALLFVLALAMIGYLHYRAFRTIQGMIIPLVTAIMGVLWALGLMGVIKARMDPWNIMTPILLLAIGAGHSVQILKRYYEEFTRAGQDHPTLSGVEHNRIAVVEATVKVGAVMLAAGAIASLSFFSLAAFGLPSIRNFGLCTGFGIIAALIVEMTFIPAIRMLMSPPTKHQQDREQDREFFDPMLEKLAEIMRQGKEGPIPKIFLVILAFAIAGVFQLKVGNNLGAQFFEGNAPVHGFRMADSRLAGTRVIQVLLEGKGPGAIKDPAVLKRMDELATFITKQPLPVGKVVSIVDVLKQLNRAINNNPAAERVPDSQEAVAQLLEMYTSDGTDDLSRLVDADRQRAVITAYIRTDDFSNMGDMTKAVDAEAERLFAGLDVKASVGGGVTNALALNETMVDGKTRNLVQISVLVVVITAILLRSIVGGFLVLLPLATSALVNLGLMGWCGILLSMGTAAISAMAVGIGADYAVYFLFRVREEFQRVGDLREAVANALNSSGKAIAYVASAVAGGYLCLTLSFLKVHVLLGLLVALTMVTSSAATVAFLPAVILWLKPKFLSRPRD